MRNRKFGRGGKVHLAPFFKSYRSSSKSGYVFNMHSYWTKQPINTVEDYIKHYTSEGDMVLDCFCGSGMIGLAAIKNNRNAVLIDISSACCHIANGYCKKIDSVAAKNAYEVIMDIAKEKCDKLYKTECEYGHEANIIFTILGEISRCSKCKNEIKVGEYNLEKIKGRATPEKKVYCPVCKKFLDRNLLEFSRFEPIEIVYNCPICKVKKGRKSLDATDYIRWNNIPLDKVWYPKFRFFGKEPKRNYPKGIFHPYQMYSKRNLYTLSIIYDAISKIYDKKMRNFFMFVFTSILFNVSLMSIYRKYENTAIKMGTLYIPSVIKDSNVILSFERKFKYILAGNKKLFERHNDKTFCNIVNKSATDLSFIDDESIDYVYIDPPYSDIINYSELNIVWESWLGDLTETREEIIVNKTEGKNLEFYEKKMTKCFNELFRVLKTNHWLTLIFHHPNPLHWMAIQTSIQNSGFKPCLDSKPIVIRSKSKTASQLNIKKHVQGFLILNFIKPEKKYKIKLKEMPKKEYVKEIEKLVLSGKKDGHTTSSELYDYVIYKLFPRVRIMDFDKNLLN